MNEKPEKQEPEKKSERKWQPETIAARAYARKLKMERRLRELDEQLARYTQKINDKRAKAKEALQEAERQFQELSK